jgi:GTP-binding protein HflX
VVDASSEQRDEQIHQVQQVLAEIGAAAVPQILIYNKIDNLELPARIERSSHGTIHKVFISAQRREGLNLVRQAMAEFANCAGTHATNDQTF